MVSTNYSYWKKLQRGQQTASQRGTRKAFCNTLINERFLCMYAFTIHTRSAHEIYVIPCTDVYDIVYVYIYIYMYLYHPWLVSLFINILKFNVLMFSLHFCNLHLIFGSMCFGPVNFTHISKDYFTGTVVITRLTQCYCSSPEEYQ